MKIQTELSLRNIGGSTGSGRYKRSTLRSQAVPTSCLRRVVVNMVTTGKIGSERNQSCTSLSEIAILRQLRFGVALRCGSWRSPHIKM